MYVLLTGLQIGRGGNRQEMTQPLEDIIKTVSGNALYSCLVKLTRGMSGLSSRCQKGWFVAATGSALRPCLVGRLPYYCALQALALLTSNLRGSLAFPPAPSPQ